MTLTMTLSDLPYTKILLSAFVIIGLAVTNWTIGKILFTLGKSKKVPNLRVAHVRKYFRIIAAFVAVLLLLTIWGVDYRGLWVFASSILAVLGVALVAQWSILSNITAGVILFFALPVRIGDEVEIIDGANSLKGVIIEINIFQVLLRDSDGNLLTYPNSLILQRPIRKIASEPLAEKGALRTSMAKIQNRLQQRKDR